MFRGTISRDAIAAIVPAVAAWHCDDLAFPCAGRFTVARALAGSGARLHGNDVTLYSCALGGYHSGGEVPLSIRDGLGLDWMAPFLGTPAGRTAAVLVFSEFAESWARRAENPYWGRMAEGARAQFGAMHAKAVAKLEGSSWKLDSYFAGDCGDFLSGLGPGAGVVTLPPIYRSGYERMFRHLHDSFDWEAPAYRAFDEGRLSEFIGRVADRPSWIYVAQAASEHPSLAGRLLAKVRSGLRGTPMFVYGSPFDVVRVAMPRQEAAAPAFAKLAPGEPVESPLALVPVSRKHFNWLRSQYLDPRIAPSDGQVRLGVLAGGKLVGALAFTWSKVRPLGCEWPPVYMLCDFAIGTAPRLAKLVVAAALSRECRLVLEGVYGRRMRSLVTTAFADRPVSMKYRGVLRLLARVDAGPGESHKYRLTYTGALGESTLADVLAGWKARNAVASPD